MTGIYEIYNIRNGKRYIGQSVDIENRWKKHQNSLNRGNHRNPYLQNAWNKYGEDAFRFWVLELCDEKDLDDREIYYITVFQSTHSEYGYNLQGGGGALHSLSDSTKARMSEVQKKRLENLEERARMSESQSRRRQLEGPEERIRMSELMKNVWQDPAYRARQSEGLKNMWQDPEHKARCSKAQKKAWEDPVRRATQSEVMRKAMRNYQKKVEQYTLEGTLVGVFISIGDAARETGCTRSSIAACCHGRLKTHGGYIWKFTNENDNTDVA